MDGWVGRADSGRVLPLRAIGQGNAVRLGGLGPSAGAAVSLVGAVVALWLLAASLLGVRVWPGAPDGESGTLRLPASPATPTSGRPAGAAERVSFRAGAPVTVIPAGAEAAPADRPRAAQRAPGRAAPDRSRAGKGCRADRARPGRFLADSRCDVRSGGWWVRRV